MSLVTAIDSAPSHAVHDETLKHDTTSLVYKSFVARSISIPIESHMDNISSEQSFVGLTSSEARERLTKFGPNDPTPVRRGALFQELLILFVNPLIVILLIAGIASGLLGQKADAGIIIVMVLLGVSINFGQTYRSQRAIERLREHVSLSATVLRDGNWQEIKRHEVVPEDLIRLSAGDLVPADARLLQARDLYVQQAALTGESMPTEKHARPGEKDTEGTPDAPDLVFLGTSVVSGIAIARVLKTGAQTAFGAIAKRLVVRPEETEFERGLRRFGMLIMRVVFVLVLFILVVRLALHKDAFESFIFAVALAVGLTPEFLPMITSVTLASGAVRMAREQVVVKHLPAIQNFGSIDVFCSDKTGTLTKGEMTLNRSLDPLGQPSDRVLGLAYVNSKFETGIRSPLDTAILAAERHELDEYGKIDEIPFDFTRRRLSIVVEHVSAQGTELLLIAKGAPEGILEVCQSYEKSGQIQPFEPSALDQVNQVYRNLCSEGFRVLAVAHRNVEAHGGFTPEDEHSLILAGFLAFADPPIEDAAESVAAMKRDGVQVKILTGDNELVAQYICGQVGLESGTPILGSELDQVSDTALAHLAEETTIFARVSPMQKLRIILALWLKVCKQG